MNSLDLNDSLREKYSKMKDSASELAVMVNTMLNEDGFYLHYPKAAEILLKYLNNLNKDINAVEEEITNNESI